MSREATRKIRKIIQAEFRKCYEHGRRARTSDIVALVQSDHPKLVAEIQLYLTTRALHDIAAKVAGTWCSVAEKGQCQLILPGMEKDLLERLPPALSVPVDGSVHDIDFVPAQTATFAEWRSHLRYLLSQYEGLGIVIAAIQELVERGTETVCPDNASLLLWLSERASTANE
jgi:hypothetical protein